MATFSLIDMYSEKLARFLREKWPNASLLAEELVAFFRAIDDLIHEGSVRIIQQGDQPPLELVASSSDQDGPIITIRRGNETITINGDGTITDGDGNTIGGGGSGADLGQIDGLEDAPDLAPFSCPGRIVSGSGTTYQVALYLSGTSQPATATVTATVPGADPSGDIPDDSYVIVYGYPVSSGGSIIASYEILGAIWL